MTEKATVLKIITKDIYQVQIYKDASHCSNCGMQSNCCQGSSVYSVKSNKSLEVGQHILIEINEKDEFLRASLVFLIPLVLSIFTATFSYQFLFPKNSLISVIFFFGILFISFFLIHFIEKRSKKFLPIVIEEIKEP